LSIVVSATSGHLGRLIVEDLLDRGVPATDVVAGARSLDAIKGLTEAGVRTAVVDYDDSSTVEGALTGGDTFVLVSGNDLVSRDRQHANARGRRVPGAAVNARAGDHGFAVPPGS
jgi:NAD(P)H dehydrogenase (quinone)